jgi:hypothetical protein
VFGNGNADAERSFSVNKKIVTQERTELKPENINAVRFVKDTLCHHDGKATDLVVTPALLHSAKSFQVQAAFRTEIESRRKEKIRSNQRRPRRKLKKIRKRDEQKEPEISIAETEQHSTLKGLEALLKEAE